MNSLFLLIPLAVVLVAGAVALLLWAINNGQFDELDDAARLADRDEP